MNIKFSKPYITGREIEYIKDVIENSRTMAGDGIYTKKVHDLIEKKYGTKKALLTTSCTTALEFAVRLLNLKSGDEIIAPSFTFSSTVNAILLSQNLKVVFAEIQPGTLNIDPDDIKRKITPRTKAIIVVHYAGVACDMDAIMAIAKEHNLKVIEDAAQAVESKYNDTYLGTIGDFGCFSFHETKNISCGEGGALLINTIDEDINERAEIIREKGTNRTKFIQGVVDKYTWVDVGSSYLPSDILAAFLFAQLEEAETITRKRREIYNRYYRHLTKYAEAGLLSLPVIPPYAHHNAHIFFVLMPTNGQRNKIMKALKGQGVNAIFHYIPLHSAPQGKKLGYAMEDLPLTEELSSRLLRLPLYPDMTVEEILHVLSAFDGAMQSLQI